ncbi:hypothetical protein BCR35DRAFT_311533 [Leucosporidium creatinivorum]|uniref:Uncharacterized protein n=1 Tax=Leucosporidium creatinivorum TaxID=106004 RepID=A0A1Y2BTK1_9BASI|nr:hypothetical protein BCR35DRAFT_311533 [Leucosporidium creatinivorum]
MWCDNCLLLFPLRGGAMALAALVALYSIGGGIFFFLYGQYFWFTYPEPQVYGAVSMIAGAISVLSIIAYSNSSYMWTRLLFFLGPFVLFLGVVRAGFAIFRLNYYQGNVVWECNHGGQLYNATLANITSYDPSYNVTADGSTSTIPTGFCSAGFHTLYLAFAFALVIDMILQIYQWFMLWRFKARLEGYFAFKSTQGGIYTA